MHKVSKCSIVVACLLLVACTTSQLILTLNIVADAASVAASTAAAITNSPLAVAVVKYAGQVSNLIPQVETELNSTDTTPVKITKISQLFANIAIPDVSNNPQLVVLVNAIASAVQIFLQQLHVATTSTTPLPATIRLSFSDRRGLSKAVATAKKTVAFASAHSN